MFIFFDETFRQSLSEHKRSFGAECRASIGGFCNNNYRPSVFIPSPNFSVLGFIKAEMFLLLSGQWKKN
jgi:hypothetical protein